MTATRQAIDLGRFSRDEQKRAGGADPAFPDLMDRLAAAAIRISADVGRAALSGNLGYAGEENPSGETQKKLDLIANDRVLEAFGPTGLVAAVVSEEMEAERTFAVPHGPGYILTVDPLDGSSNTDINGPVGTIFALFRRSRTGACDDVLGELRDDARMIAGGYVMYGPGTILVYSRGDGVNGFTLDPDAGRFLLTHPGLRSPERGKYYSANLGNYRKWDGNVRRFVDWITEKDPETKRPYSLRYVGALVADLHRNLIDGGIYFYPPDEKNPNGKLRLLYECAPLAFLIEAAGGRATNGRERILDLRPGSLHQRVPLVIGGGREVGWYGEFLAGGTP